MSTEQVVVSLAKRTATPQHPLGPLTAAEISESARLIKGSWPSNTNVHFKSITLQEPKKAELLPFLAAEHSRRRTPTVERKSFVLYYIRNTVSLHETAQRSSLLINPQDKLHEAIVNLSLGEVESNLRLGPYVHSPADGDEIVKVEKIALEDEKVQAEIAKLQLPEGTVLISDPWIYGTLCNDQSWFFP
jgi:primary-amine oxidase